MGKKKDFWDLADSTILGRSKKTELLQIARKEHGQVEIEELMSDDGRKLFIRHNPNSKPYFNSTNDMVDWARWTWNPVTGCFHNCGYCYARDIANRF
jgi:hypothetical protein